MISVKWKPVVGYEGLYDVSNDGRVRRPWNFLKATPSERSLPPGRVLKPHPSAGYLAVNLQNGLNGNTRRIHQLVAAAFIGPANGLQVNHRDGNKFNNRFGNLEYLTHAENTRHAVRTGLWNNRGELGTNARMSEAIAMSIIIDISLGHRTSVIADKHSVSWHVVSKIKHCHSWAHLPRPDNMAQPKRGVS